MYADMRVFLPVWVFLCRRTGQNACEHACPDTSNSGNGLYVYLRLSSRVGNLQASHSGVLESS